MSFRTSRNKDDQPDFEEMMSEVNEEIQEKDAEQDIVNRVPELKELSANIAKLVLSIKLMPVHSPKQNISRERAIWTATRDSNSTKRLYDTALGNQPFGYPFT